MATLLKPTVIAGGILLALAGYFGYHTVYVKQQRELATLQEQLTQEQQNQALRVDVAGALQEIDGFRQRLPSEVDIEWLVGHLSRLADQAGIRLEAITPQTPKKLGEFTSLSVSFKFAMPSYFQLVKFLHAVERAEAFLRIDELEVSRPVQGASQVHLVVGTLHLPAGEGVLQMARRAMAAAQPGAGNARLVP